MVIGETKCSRKQICERKSSEQNIYRAVSGFLLLLSLSHIEFSPQNLEKEYKTYKHIKINNHNDNDRYFILVWRWPSTGILKYHTKSIKDKGLWGKNDSS